MSDISTATANRRLRPRGAGARPTIRDVAQVTGVSSMTVSRVINGQRWVAPETRDRVERAARALGYAPNRLARGLVRGTSHVIGLLVPDSTNPYVGELVRAIHRVADDEGYVVTMCVTEYDAERETRALDVLLQHRVAGLLVTAPSLRGSDEQICALAERGVPIVSINRDIQHPRIAVATSDSRQGSYQATAHLLELGHRRIAYITGSPRVGLGRRKLAGYQAALTEHQVPLDQSLIVGSDLGVRDGFLAMQLLLHRSPRPTAVLAVNDSVAIGAMGAIEAAGLCIPQDISVIGFDDIPYASSVHPALTTVAQPIHELGRLGARMLLDLLQTVQTGDGGTPLRTVLPCPLVLRASTGPCDPQPVAVDHARHGHE